MKITIDTKAGATYIYLNELKVGEFVHRTKMVGNYIIDYMEDGTIIGIEVLSLPKIEIDGKIVKVK